MRSGRDAAPCRSPSRSDARAVSPRPGQNQARTLVSATSIGRGVDLAAVPDVPTRPELLEVDAVACRELGRLHGEDHVLLARPRVDRPVRRAGPHRRLVADDVLVVHQVGHARDGRGRERQRLDELGLRLRRRRHGHGVAVVVEVVGEPHVDAARGGVLECVRRAPSRRGPAAGCRRSRSRACAARPTPSRRADARSPRQSGPRR